MSVVPARVHHARRAGGERRREDLGERQRVDIRAPCDRLARLVTAQIIAERLSAAKLEVKTGIAGEKYFEVLSGLKEGDAVITGPFASVRALAEGALTLRPRAPRRGRCSRTC